MTTRILPAVALVILAVACSDGATPNASPSPSAKVVPTVLPASTPTPEATPTWLAEGTTRYFRSPSGNIGCAIEATAAVCDIIERTWSAPPEPASCEFDWGQSVGVSASPPKAEFLCVSDTVINAQAPALAFGKSATHNGFVCESRENGIRCVHIASRHGFLVGRAAYELF